MQKILQGVHQFREDVFRQQQAEFERLAAKQQRPIALLITCSDSRINPNMITQTDPGDLFLIRNAGNIVPPYGAVSSGEIATIEYAVSVLGIRNIILCGHSHCGALDALMRSQDFADYPAVSRWFAHAEATKRIAIEKFGHLSGRELAREISQQNVLVQMAHLRTHPCVALGLATGELEIHGWYYQLDTGEILDYSDHEKRFVLLT
jgi:carbonic anhydrase